MEEMNMIEEYDIKALNPRKNPYAKKIKKPVTVNNPPPKGSGLVKQVHD